VSTVGVVDSLEEGVPELVEAMRSIEDSKKRRSNANAVAVEAVAVVERAIGGRKGGIDERTDENKSQME
jgi:hypothetical protein